jgi:hypothetical protein
MALGTIGSATPYGNPIETAGTQFNQYPVVNTPAARFLAEQEKAQQKQDFDIEKAMLQYQQELIKGNQSGAFQILNTLLQQGGLSPEQLQAALGEYSEAQDTLRNAVGGANRMANEGKFTDRERVEFLSRYNPAYERARELSQTGGVSDEDWNDLMGGYNENRGRVSAVADRGAMTEDEYEQNLAAAQQSVQDQFRNAAASTYNSANLGGSPFAASAILAKGAREAGANRANVKADLDKYQADTRMQGMDALTQFLNSQSSQQLGRGQNMLSGLSQQSGLVDQIANFLNQDAEGRLAGINALGNLGSQQGAIASDRAKLQTQLDTGSPYSDAVNQIIGSIGATANVGLNKKGKPVAETPYAKTNQNSLQKQQPKANVHSGRRI